VHAFASSKVPLRGKELEIVAGAVAIFVIVRAAGLGRPQIPG
jgi:hypothetical protein